MVDGVRGRVRHRHQERLGIGDVHLVVDDDHLVADLPEMVSEPRADEAAAAGDEGAHDGSPYCLPAGPVFRRGPG
jgi:hypothetical protein